MVFNEKELSSEQIAQGIQSANLAHKELSSLTCSDVKLLARECGFRSKVNKIFILRLKRFVTAHASEIRVSLNVDVNNNAERDAARECGFRSKVNKIFILRLKRFVTAHASEIRVSLNVDVNNNAERDASTVQNFEATQFSAPESLQALACQQQPKSMEKTSKDTESQQKSTLMEVPTAGVAETHEEPDSMTAATTIISETQKEPDPLRGASIFQTGPTTNSENPSGMAASNLKLMTSHKIDGVASSNLVQNFEATQFSAPESFEALACQQQPKSIEKTSKDTESEQKSASMDVPAAGITEIHEEPDSMTAATTINSETQEGPDPPRGASILQTDPTTNSKNRPGTAASNQKLTSGQNIEGVAASNLKVTSCRNIENESHQKQKPSSVRNRIEEFIGQFEIPVASLQRIWSSESGTFIPRKYASIIGKHLTESKLTNCLVYINNYRKNKRNVTINAYCAYNGCKIFKIVSATFPSDKEPLLLTLMSYGTEHHSGKKKDREINGFIRDDLKNNLSVKKPFEVRQELLEAVTPEMVAENDHGDVRPLGTLSQARAELFAKYDKHPDALISTILDWIEQVMGHVPDDVNQPEKHIHVQKVGAPLFAFLQSKSELGLFLLAISDNLVNGRGPVLHLDASSSIVKPYVIDNVQNLKCFYYGLCFSLRGKVVTLASAILSQHDACRIGQWLLDVRAFLSMHKQWPISNNIVVIDTSFPFLYAVLLVFNNMDLVTYLKVCHNYVVAQGNKEDVTWDKNLTIVRSCCNHKIKNFSSMMKEEGRSMKKENRQFIIRCCGSMINCTLYESVKIILNQIFILLLNKEKNSAVVNASGILQEVLDGTDEGYLSNIDEELLSDLASTTEAKKAKKETDESLLYVRSPFYQDVLPSYEDILKSTAKPTQSNSNKPTQSNSNMKKTQSKAPSNEFYCPPVADFILKHHVPLLCLWTGIMKREDPKYCKDPVRFSNAIAESLIKIFKVDILKKVAVRLNRFTYHSRRFVLLTEKDIKLNLAKQATKNPDIKKHNMPIKKTIKRKYNKARPTGTDVIAKPAKKLKLIVETQRKPRKPPSSNSQECADFPPFDTEEVWKRRNTPPKYCSEAKQLAFTENRPLISERSLSEQIVEKQPVRVETIIGDNGLVQNPEYYSLIFMEDNEESEMLNYAIAKFTENLEKKIMFDDFMSLDERGWIKMNIMDSVAQLLLKEEKANNVGYFPAEHAVSIMNGWQTSNAEEFLRSTNCLTKEFLVCFYAKRGTHWCFVFINTLESIVYVLDPMFQNGSGDSSCTANQVKALIAFARRVCGTTSNWQNKNWSIQSRPHPLQDEYYNSGIYCLYYLLHVLREGQMDIPFFTNLIEGCESKFNASSYRLKLKLMLLSSSDNMKTLCYVCCKVGEEERIVRCSKCRRFAHKRPLCLRMFICRSGKLICKLCDKFKSESDFFSSASSSTTLVKETTSRPSFEREPLEVYPNGLIKNTDYYRSISWNEKLVNYPVGLYDFSEVLGCGNLFLSDFESLAPNVTVLDNVMDVVACIFRSACENEKLFHHVNINKVRMILDPQNFLDDWEIFPDECKYIIMIECRGGHYCLIIMNRRDHNVLYMDPYGGANETVRGNNVLQQLEHLNTLMNLDELSSGDCRSIQSLKLDNNHIKQPRGDTVNCGVYCLYFLYQFLRPYFNRGFNLFEAADFTVNAFRHYLQQTLLRNSCSLSEVCYICNLALNVNDQNFVNNHRQCSYCRHFVHCKRECMMLEGYDHIKRPETSEFTCIRCRFYNVPLS